MATTVNKEVVKSLNKLQKKTARFMTEIEKQLGKATAGKTVNITKLSDIEASVYGAVSDASTAAARPAN